MKIGIVNDSPIAVESLRRIVSSSPQHSIEWIAYNGIEAVRLCSEKMPNLILMDLIMPKMDGVEATRQIMQNTPCAILVVTASVVDNASKVFEAMGAGALDAVVTPILGMGNNTSGGAVLLEKIDKISKLIGIRDNKKEKTRHSISIDTIRQRRECLVAVGSSTGGPQALVEVLTNMPKDYPASIVIIQHMDEQFTPGLVAWLGSQIDLPVELVKSGDRPKPGHVHFGRTSGHLIMERGGTFNYTDEPRNIPYHPSVDVFFSSIASNWQGTGIGVLLTGMGKDGARGLLELHEKGWYTIAQDEASSIVYGMPKAAAELDAADKILSLDCIGPECIDLLSPNKGFFYG